MPRNLGVLLLSLMLALSTTALIARADSDEPVNTAAGLQPLSDSIPPARRFHTESPLVLREDGSYQAVPEIHGNAKIFHLVERSAPWTLRPGLTVMAKTYNGVVPGPTIVVNQGDHVVIDLLNALDVPDTLHLHGIHGTSVEMDGVAGISQQQVLPGTSYRYVFDAKQSGTFIYHTHGSENMIDAGLYGGIIVNPGTPRPEEIVAHDYLQILSAWKIQSLGENHFTINGKSYPATKALEIAQGQRVRIRWVNISSENDHTMHTHGHDQLVIARDAQPLTYRDVEDTLMLGPGQRADVVVNGDARPGTWLIHCHVMDHVEDSSSMPDGLITALHYTGTPNTLTSMQQAMTMTSMRMPSPALARVTQTSPKKLDTPALAILSEAAGIAGFFTFLLVGSRRLPRESILGINAVAGAILLFLTFRIAPNLSYQPLQELRAWSGGAAFPFVAALALLSGLFIGFAGMCMSAAGDKKPADIGWGTLAQGASIGAAATSGATLLALQLITGFMLYNAAKGFGVATRFPMTPMTARGTFLGMIALLTCIPILIGAFIGYSCSGPAFTTFFLAVGCGMLIYGIGELAADMLVIVGAHTSGESPR